MATLEVDIWGEKIKLSSGKDSEFIRRVADFLNEKMREVQSNDATLLTTKIAALRAAYLVAAEYLLLMGEMGKLEGTVEQIEKKLASVQFDHL